MYALKHVKGDDALLCMWKVWTECVMRRRRICYDYYVIIPSKSEISHVPLHKGKE